MNQNQQQYFEYIPPLVKITMIQTIMKIQDQTIQKQQTFGHGTFSIINSFLVLLTLGHIFHQKQENQLQKSIKCQYWYQVIYNNKTIDKMFYFQQKDIVISQKYKPNIIRKNLDGTIELKSEQPQKKNILFQNYKHQIATINIQKDRQQLSTIIDLNNLPSIFQSKKDLQNCQLYLLYEKEQNKIKFKRIQQKIQMKKFYWLLKIKYLTKKGDSGSPVFIKFGQKFILFGFHHSCCKDKKKQKKHGLILKILPDYLKNIKIQKHQQKNTTNPDVFKQNEQMENDQDPKIKFQKKQVSVITKKKDLTKEQVEEQMDNKLKKFKFELIRQYVNAVKNGKQILNELSRTISEKLQDQYQWLKNEQFSSYLESKTQQIVIKINKKIDQNKRKNNL